MASEYLENMTYSDERSLFHYERGDSLARTDLFVGGQWYTCGAVLTIFSEKPCEVTV
jgi:hypothetical protein